MSGPLLEASGLSVRFGGLRAVSDVDLALHPGRLLGVIGPNGAGKSTLINVLTGHARRSAGTVRVGGRDLTGARPWRIAHAGVARTFQSVTRNLQFHADLQGLPRELAAERIAFDAARFGLLADMGRRVRELSGGSRRKVELVRALLHRPELLLMDEATVGLDPKSRRDLIEALHDEVRKRGVTVLWATHLVSEAEGADRVLVLHRGELLADGTPGDVTAALGGSTLEAAFINATH